MFIRKAKFEDKLYLFNWVNNKDSLSAKIENQHTIPIVEHEKWFAERLKDNNTHIWVIENQKRIPIGQIRLQKKIDKFFDIDIYLLKQEREKGLASKALNLVLNKENLLPVRAIVKKSNKRSFSFFSNNGFILKSEDKFIWILIKNK